MSPLHIGFPLLVQKMGYNLKLILASWAFKAFPKKGIWCNKGNFQKELQCNKQKKEGGSGRENLIS